MHLASIEGMCLRHRVTATVANRHIERQLQLQWGILLTSIIIECSLISVALNHTNNFIIIHVKLARTRCSFCSKIKSYLHSDLSL